MFKKFVLPAVALAAITSCSSDEVLNTNSNPDGQDYISFNTVVGNNSRVTETQKSTLEEDANGFYVVAYGSKSLYFHRSAAKYNAGTTGENAKAPGFYLDTDYYWPNYQLTFAAWYPTTLTTDNGSWSVTGDGLNTADGEYVSRPTFNDGGEVTTRHQIQAYSLPTTLANQKDIIIAREYAEKPNGTATSVGLNFQHIFSQIGVTAKYEGEDEVQVKVAGVALRYIPNKGTFTFPEGETSTSSLTTDLWTIDNSKYVSDKTGLTDADLTKDLSRFKHEISETVLTSTPTTLNGGSNNFLVIPQNFKTFAWSQNANKDGAYLAVKVQISTKQADGSYKQLYPATEGNYGWAAVGAFGAGVLESLVPGTRYVINLTFTDKSAGKVDPDPIDPDPTEPDPFEPGDDILGEPIWFTVDVAAWQPTTSAGTATNIELK